MAQKYKPPGDLRDFDRSGNPQALYDAWERWIGGQVGTDPSYPAWYDPGLPPSMGRRQASPRL